MYLLGTEEKPSVRRMPGKGEDSRFPIEGLLTNLTNQRITGNLTKK